MNTSNELDKLFEALAKAQTELKSVAFDSQNPFFNNAFASLQAIQDATRPILAKHGLAVSQIISGDLKDGYWLHTVLGHSSGQYLQSSIQLIMSKQDMQQMGSASTYARRYAWQNIVGVAGDKDDDAEAAVGPRDKPGRPAPPKITPKPEAAKPGPKNEAPMDRQQSARIVHLLGERQISQEVFQKYLKECHAGATSRTLKFWQADEIIGLLELEDCSEGKLMAEVARRMNG